MKGTRKFGGEIYTYVESFFHFHDLQDYMAFQKKRGFNVRVVKGSSYTSKKLADRLNIDPHIVGDKSRVGSRVRWDVFIRKRR